MDLILGGITQICHMRGLVLQITNIVVLDVRVKLQC